MKWLFGVTAALGLTLTACGSGHTATNQAGSVGGGQSAASVAVAQNPTQGAILVNGAGRTLYLFEEDHGTTSACTGACAQVWPAVTGGAQPTGAPGVDMADGQVPGQVTYNGHLLYTYSGDAASGDVHGLGIPNWYPVSPSGDKVDKEDGQGSSNGGY